MVIEKHWWISQSNGNDSLATMGGDTLKSGRMTDLRQLSSYFFFWTFSAAFVTLPLVASLKLTDLMTPTATVCRISRTANRPNGGYSWKLSTQSGLVGTKLMIAASPDLMALGFSSVVLPERRSHFSLISANLHAMCAV